ncbi:MAG: hypothetical protein WBX01_14925, partial [Nitrososphaeraceae archaeon]
PQINVQRVRSKVIVITNMVVWVVVAAATEIFSISNSMSYRVRHINMKKNETFNAYVHYQFLQLHLTIS